jgi:phosphoribosylformimino-5-aminoimidazole carboxamide ribotide isomerase
MIVIPAIDLLNGKAVRLHQGRYDEVTVYDEDPPARARGWRGKVPRLHVVDLEGARAGRPVQEAVVRAVVSAFGPGVQIGGGVRSAEAAAAYLALGVDRVVIGTSAVTDPELVLSLAKAHPDRIVLAVDAKDGKVRTDGWTVASEATAAEVVDVFRSAAIAAILYTDIARDGTRAGPNVESTALLAKGSPFPVIASGGVGSLDHLRALARAGIGSAIVGRALYDGSFTLDEAIDAARDA